MNFFFKGVIPDHNLGVNSRTTTVVDFCCRSDGFAANPVYLPNTKPFLLYKADKGECQAVHGMDVSQEWFKWDVENKGGNKGIIQGVVPYGYYDHDITLFFCFYCPSNQVCEPAKYLGKFDG